MHRAGAVRRNAGFSSVFATLTGAVAAAVAGCVEGGDATWGEGAEAEGPPLVDPGKADGDGWPAYAPLPPGADLEAPLVALFAPDDPVITLELALIDEVRARRRADDRVFAEGENPYRIRYAVYNIRNPHVVAHLADAEDEGVDVQILIEADQLDPARDWNTSDEFLVARGFELVRDHRTLDAAGRRTADLVGIAGSGLMHLKTRIYEAPGWRAALSGSMNPGDEAVANDETLHLVRDERLIHRYAAMVDAVLRGALVANVWDEGAAMNVMFTPAKWSGPQAGTKLLQWLEAEEEQILLMVFSLRDVTAPGVSRSLVQILADKARAGVPVWLITDRKQSDGVDAEGRVIASNDKTEDRLRAAGVRVYEVMNLSTPYTAMHHKAAILGRTRVRVITDAANWTRAALGSATTQASNHESVLFIDAEALDGGLTGRRYLAAFAHVLAKYAAQSAADGLPGWAEAWAELSGLSGWPAQQVAFEAVVATSWGEAVWVRGDDAALGAWGAVGAGVPLATDAASYPTWHGAPVTLPVGQPFEWKLVAGAPGGAVRWEQGANRVGRAAPVPLVTNDVAVLRARWR